MGYWVDQQNETDGTDALWAKLLSVCLYLTLCSYMQKRIRFKCQKFISDTDMYFFFVF